MSLPTETSKFNGLLRADHKRKPRFYHWFFLVFFSLLAIVSFSEIVVDWAGFGELGWRTGLMVGGIAMTFVITLVYKIRKSPGLRGIGFRLVGNGQIELLRVEPAGNGGRDPMGSLNFISGGKLSAKRLTVFVNIERTERGAWVVGDLAIKDHDDQPVIVLSFIPPDFEKISRLYMLKDEAAHPMAEQPMVEQLRAVSELIERSGAKPKLMFQEGAKPETVAMADPDAFTLFAFVAASLVTTSVKQKRQTRANAMIEAGNLPVEPALQDQMTKIVQSFGYEIVVNEDPMFFVETLPDKIAKSLPNA